jgi:hypothetical protein
MYSKAENQNRALGSLTAKVSRPRKVAKSMAWMSTYRVIERTTGWLERYRRLGRDYEHQTFSSKAMVFLASIHHRLRLTTNDT